MATSAVETATTGARSVPADLRARLRSERRAVTNEIEAFDAFIDRVTGIPAESPAPSGGLPGVDCRGDGGGSESASGLRRVRDAYEGTVMDVPHYEDDYDDTYRESVVAEFGPEIGGALTDGSRFQSHLKRATVGAAESCRADRERYLETLDTEAESVETVGSELRTVEAEVRGLTSEPSSVQGYGALEAEWRRLGVLAGTLEQLATTRQDAIIRQRREFTIPTSAPDVPTFLYDGFDDDYPLLSYCVDLRKRVQRARAERERKLAGL